jgi:hypothetical protein
MLVHLLYRRGGCAALPQQRILAAVFDSFASFGVPAIIPHFLQNCQLYFAPFYSFFFFHPALSAFLKSSKKNNFFYIMYLLIACGKNGIILRLKLFYDFAERRCPRR